MPNRGHSEDQSWKQMIDLENSAGKDAVNDNDTGSHLVLDDPVIDVI